MNGKLYNFRVPVYKGFPSHEWNETRPLTMIGGQIYEGEKFRFLKKWMVYYTTLGFPFIRGFPSHEWSDTRVLTLIGDQLSSLNEGFHFIHGTKGVVLFFFMDNIHFSESETFHHRSLTLTFQKAKLFTLVQLVTNHR